MMAERQNRLAVTGLFAVTVFLSAFLIFQVQPLISKYILPWFGGTPGVWTACLLFFQTLLFGGYAYAHGLDRLVRSRWQVLVHGGLLLATLCLLPISPDPSWKPTGNEPPTWWIVGLLAATVGLPYFLLSATGPLLQGWFGRTNPGVSPYRLYALSNLGSVLGLVTYPFLFEPLFSAETQALCWSVGFGAFAICCIGCGICLWNSPAWEVPASEHESTEKICADDLPPSRFRQWLWVGLAACPSTMLLVTTNQVCLDVAVMPFLWVLPLTLYLVSFILCFDQSWWYPRRSYASALAVTIFCLTGMMNVTHESSLLVQVVIHFSLLFFCCMVCHGELVRLKPGRKHLTAFYLAMSAGGALGGLWVGVAAPLLFTDYIEFPAAILVCGVIAIAVLRDDQAQSPDRWNPRNWGWVACCSLLAMIGGLRSLSAMADEEIPGQKAQLRNFYGLLRVLDTETQDPEIAMRRMVHGRILHGMQFLAPAKSAIPTVYYGEHTGAGLVLTHCQPHRVGVVGLGVGTLATYSQPGDYYRFYEINPDVIRLAQEQFSYLSSARGTMETVLGDARLSLERETPQEFDLLVLDAFSSDAIPAHLLTTEAFAIYKRHLGPRGAIAIHITNRHFDLQPIIRGAAEAHGLTCATIHSVTRVDRAQARADWMILSEERSLFQIAEIRDAIQATQPSQRPAQLWTDSYNNVVGILK